MALDEILIKGAVYLTMIGIFVYGGFILYKKLKNESRIRRIENNGNNGNQ